MKKLNAILITMVAALMLVSCLYEELDEQVLDEMKFSINMADEGMSRLTTDASLSSVFDEGDSIGIFVYKREAGEAASIESNEPYAENVKMVYTGGGVWQIEAPIYYPNNGTVLDVYAYYPYRAEARATALRYNATTGMGDLLIASHLGANKAGKTAIPLFFERMLSMIQMVAEGSNNLPSFDDTFDAYFHGIVSCDYNIATGKMSNPKRGVAKMKLTGPPDPQMRLFAAWVPEQTLMSGTIFSYIQTSSMNEFSLGKDVTNPLALVQGEVSRFYIQLETQVGRDVTYDIYDIYPKHGNPIGIVISVYNDGYSGKLISIYALDAVPWSTVDVETGATDSYDGVSNKMKIQAIEGWREMYPALRACVDLGERWFLPALEEIYQNMYLKMPQLNRVLREIEGATMIEKWQNYHTSTETSASGVNKMLLGNDFWLGDVLVIPGGDTSPGSKSESRLVRPFYEF